MSTPTLMHGINFMDASRGAWQSRGKKPETRRGLMGVFEDGLFSGV
jgi:hypothetical protein